MQSEAPRSGGINGQLAVCFSILLAPVVQTLDSAIHRINHYPSDLFLGKQLHYWIEIYPVDSAIHLLNHWGQINQRICIRKTNYIILWIAIYLVDSIIQLLKKMGPEVSFRLCRGFLAI